MNSYQYTQQKSSYARKYQKYDGILCLEGQKSSESWENYVVAVESWKEYVQVIARDDIFPCMTDN